MNRSTLGIKLVAFRHEGEHLLVWIPNDRRPHLPTRHSSTRTALTQEVKKLLAPLGSKPAHVEQLYSFGAGDLGRTAHSDLTVAYLALIPPEAPFEFQDWKIVSRLNGLGEADRRILSAGLSRLRAKIRYQPLGLALLPKKFTLSQLQKLYETTLARSFDKRNFRKKWLSLSVLKPLNETEHAVQRRAARLYSINRSAYKGILVGGSEFHI